VWTYGIGNASFFAGNGVDETGSHTSLGLAYPQGADWYFGPSAIIGSTTKRSFALIGDSRTIGIQDGPSDPNRGCTGETARAINTLGFGHLNLGVGFDRADKYIASHTRRLALAGYCSDVVLGFGANDLFARTSAQIVADSQTIAGYFAAGVKKYIYTLPPIAVTSSDGFATVANQSINFPEFERRIYNGLLRAGVTGFVKTWEIADVPESARDSGKWRVDLGLLNGFPIADATHENALGNSTIASSGAITIP
jgi:hypothetical protein